MRAALILLSLSATLMTTGCATVSKSKDEASASAPLRMADGRQIGTVRLSERRDGVRVNITAAGLYAGPLGVHLHEVGRCEDAGFVAAGPHWNPASRKHGHLSDAGPHAGDLGNLAVGRGGVVKTEREVPGFRLRGSEDALIDGNGTALIVHAKADDERTDPGGNSGDRIACAAFPL